MAHQVRYNGTVAHAAASRPARARREPKRRVSYWSFNVNHGAFVVYRLANDAAVLYIGQTDDLFRRLGEHARRAPWWPDVNLVEWRDYETRDEALAAEREAIKAMRPRHNVLHAEPSPWEQQQAARAAQAKATRAARSAQVKQRRKVLER